MFDFKFAVLNVSIHAPTRGATIAPIAPFSSKMFQSTHPHGVRLRCPLIPTRSGYLFQSTHPHGVRRYRKMRPRIAWCFNPRTHTGCDLTRNQKCTHLLGFNPRTHTGCDYPVRSVHLDALLVSIHAPTRGATEAHITAIAGIAFQSTHPHGVRPSQPSDASAKSMFQSTHPHGVRHRKRPAQP